MTPSAGDVWSADRNDEVRRLVLVISDSRLHRLAGRAIVVPLVSDAPASPRPWEIPLAPHGWALAHLVGSVPIDRLLRRVALAPSDTLQQVRRALQFMTNS